MKAMNFPVATGWHHIHSIWSAFEPTGPKAQGLKQKKHNMDPKKQK